MPMNPRGPITSVSERLASSAWLPWRVRHLGGPLNTLVGAPVQRRRLLRDARSWMNHGRLDVSVVIGVRNRADHRLANALASLRSQRYPEDLIEVIVVDFGSEPRSAERLKALTALHRCEYVRSNATGAWNRGQCLNIGIRRARGKFLLTADTDIIFSDRYIEACVAVLRESPLSAVYSRCLDLPEGAIDADGPSAEARAGWMDGLRAQAAPRYTHISSGICFTATRYLHMVRGYDEAFTQYGCEDEDLEKRLAYLGLSAVTLAPETAYYLHQWHPTHEGVRSPTLEAAIESNRAYLASTHSIVRNGAAWGMPDLDAGIAL